MRLSWQLGTSCNHAFMLSQTPAIIQLALPIDRFAMGYRASSCSAGTVGPIGRTPGSGLSRMAVRSTSIAPLRG